MAYEGDLTRRSILVALRAKPGGSYQQIADAVGRSLSYTFVSIRQLEKLGQVEQRPCTCCGRPVWMVVDGAGR